MVRTLERSAYKHRYKVARHALMYKSSSCSVRVQILAFVLRYSLSLGTFAQLLLESLCLVDGGNFLSFLVQNYLKTLLREQKPSYRPFVSN